MTLEQKIKTRITDLEKLIVENKQIADSSSTPHGRRMWAAIRVAALEFRLDELQQLLGAAAASERDPIINEGTSGDEG
jgi:hypothetical protein